MSPHDLTPDGLRRVIAELVEEEPESIDPDANLFALGLASIEVMRLVGGWRRAGLTVNFAELAEQPTLAGWTGLVAARSPAAAQPPRTAAPEPPVEPGDPDAEFPLAVMQHAYWVGRTDGQRLGGVAAHLYTEFDTAPGGGVDPGRLGAALERLVERHAMLRAHFTDDGRQRIGARSGWRGLTVHDLRGLDGPAVGKRLEHTRDLLSHQMLRIDRGEVFSTALSLLPGDRTRLHLDVDMVAADAVSYRLLLADLARLHTDPDTELPAIGYGYRQYRAARPGSRATAAARAARYWADRLPELPGAPELPLAAATGDRPAARVTRRHFVLGPDGRRRLTEAARRRGLTPAMAVATAFAEVVGAWSAQPRFLLNVPLFDREPLHPDIDRVVGDFTGSVLLDVDLSRPLPFVERARAVQARMHADMAHADHSGVEVLRDLSRRAGEQVLAPVVFTSALNLGELFHPAVRTAFGEPVWIVSQGPQVLLDAQITELGGGLLVNWDIREDELAPGVAPAMFAAFEQLVRRLTESGPAWDLPVDGLLPAAQLTARERANDTARPRRDRPLHQDFFDRAGTHPEAPALLWGEDGVLTHGELADRALRVAQALRNRGVGPGDRVGVTLPKGPDQAVAVLGALAAGAAYVPLGVEQPPARAARITAAAGFAAVIAERGGAGSGSGDDGAGTARALTLADALAEIPPGAAPAPYTGDPEHPAYLLFTSGSTGEPKGVDVPHRAAVNTLDDLVERYALGPDDRTLALSALDFDLSVFDLFAPLSTGGAVVWPGQDDRRDARSWAELVNRHRVTVLNCVPALLDMLLTTGEELGTSLRLVLLGGDRIAPELPGRLGDAVPGCRFVGLGGTTETAIHSTVREVDTAPAHWHSVPYGTPLGNVVCRVVDPLGRDCPDWVPGELWIGGDGVALGYRGDPGRTADRFVQHLGRRWYRTGDQARYTPADGIEFLGRRDHQVKIRGFRIELGEVEAALAADPRVRSAVALATGTPAALVAAVVPAAADAGREPAPGAEPAPDPGAGRDPESAPDRGAGPGGGPDHGPEALREALRALLPPHMVPDRITFLEALPLTANGKTDRAAVAALTGRDRSGPARTAPSTPLERAVAHIWEETLAVRDIPADEELFALGGDSVRATGIVARIREDLDAPQASVRMLFAAPTVAGLARALAAAHPDPGRLDRVARLFLDIEALSDDEVAARLEAAGTPDAGEGR
ncbi:amino acid adenylation domain-containing protein [Streptomyces sp. NPDC001985]|uniref:non-ribosomal peptide synthetase n=1 Tax=Streptomyces sp. NPDC001985 TaxID=3154406 RepID=UPI00331811D6